MKEHENNFKQQTTIPYYSILFVSDSLWILVFLPPQRGSNAGPQQESGSGVTATGNPQNVQLVGRFHYPLLNIQKTMENHNFYMGKSTISMVIVNSYVKLPEGIWGFLK